MFSCPVRRKLVSVCASPGGGAAYRFGRPGRLEIRSSDLSLARRTFSGGGETQISVKGTGGYSYVVFTRTLRSGFGTDSRNHAQSNSGVVVRHSGRTLAVERCGGAGDQPIDEGAARGLPAGTYVVH